MVILSCFKHKQHETDSQTEREHTYYGVVIIPEVSEANSMETTENAHTVTAIALS